MKALLLLSNYLKNLRGKSPLFLFVILFPVSQFQAQIVRDTFEIPTDTFRLSFKNIAPFSLNFEQGGKNIPDSTLEINYLRGWVIPVFPIDSSAVVISYRYLSDFLNSSYALRKYVTREESEDNFRKYLLPQDLEQFQEIVERGNLRKSGSISRGITVGNNQNMSLNSGLQMQIEGDVGDGISIIGAITDENIPIQPDGTTQQLSDFDKVFIKLLKGDNSVTLGDYEITKKGTQFADFYRNVQGIGFNIKAKNHAISINGAVAKGKFYTNSIKGLDGVQGPYRVTGKNNERFIIILAGSEKIYHNGTLLIRGEGNDYTIDYNNGEIYFTNNLVITSASRIVIDFEYNDRYYNRSLLFINGNGSLFSERLKYQISYGRDADNQNAPIDLAFDQDDKDSLKMAGDQAQQATSSGVDSIGYEEGAIRYEKVDTISAGNVYEIFKLSSDPETAVFTLNMALVGENKGFYMKSTKSINGTSFEWVGPDSLGIPKGNYQPIKILVLPSLLQVSDARFSYLIGKKVELYSESALSSLDKNRFSPLDEEDNLGFAQKGGIRTKKIAISDSLSLNFDLSHKYIQKTYSNLDRINKVEYNREWDVESSEGIQTENVSELKAGLNIGKKISLNSDLGYRFTDDSTRSLKQKYTLTSKHKILQGWYSFFNVNKISKSGQSNWTRHTANINKKVKGFKPGIEIWIEKKQNDSLVDGNFRFWDLKPYLEYDDGKKLQLKLSSNLRNEKEVNASIEKEKSFAHTEYLKITYSPIKALKLQNTSSYRDYILRDTSFREQGLESKKNLMTNLQLTYFPKSRFIISSVNYEISAEQLARKQVAFRRVNDGLGQYQYISDLNENGQEDLEEFQLSTNPLMANYIRFLIPTTDFFPTTGLNLSGNLRIDPKKLWQKESEGPKWLKSMMTQWNFRLFQKKAEGKGIKNYLVNLSTSAMDTTMLENRFNLRGDYFLFKNNPKGDLKFSYSSSSNKQFLETGTEWRANEFLEFLGRKNFGKNKSLELNYKVGTKESEAQNMASRNFDINFHQIGPAFNLQFSRRFRLSSNYQYKHKVNNPPMDSLHSKVNIHTLGMEGKLNLKKRNNISSKLSFVLVTQEGTPSFSADYELKESLQTGFNILGNIFSTIYLNKSLELSMTYDGRYSVEKGLIHSGRVQIKAFF